MSKHTFAFVSLLFVSLVLCSVFDARAQESEIDKIIKEVSVDNQKGAILNYTYLMKFSYARHKKFAGKKFTRLYEAILPSRFAMNRAYSHRMLLIQDSEKNLTSEEIMIARKALAKDLEKTENEADTPANQAAAIEDGGYWTASFVNEGKKIKIDIMTLLQNSTLGNLQRKNVGGRNIATIDFSPKADAVFEKTLTYLSKIEGQITIDETDKRIIKIEGFAQGEFDAQKDKPDAERQKAMVFIFAQTKVGEGFWFPQTIFLNFEKHPEIFEPIEIHYNFSAYKRASVDVKDTIETPKEPAPTTTEEKKN